METPKPRSFFQDLRLREVNGFRVRKRPYMGNDTRDFDPIGAVAVEHSGEPSPPMALSFCKKFLDLSSYQENAEKSKVSEWMAHANAIFDLCWIKMKTDWNDLLQDDELMLTASGDQSGRFLSSAFVILFVMVVHQEVCFLCCFLLQHLENTDPRVFILGSFYAVSELVVSGSRDGSFAVWDTRCSRNTNQKFCVPPISVIHEAHTSPGRRRPRRGKAESRSITSVLYLKDEVSIATAGAVDSVIKLWDSRHLKAPVTHACPNSESSEEKRFHGISSLSQDLNGVFIAASCMDHRIYLYNVLQLEKGPMRTFSGGRTDSFFVKSSISPDAAHILSGSSDGNAYIWQVNKPLLDPITLKSHDGEVTAVDWCPSDMGKVATCSDDFSVRLWNIQSSCYSSTRSPSSMRKRVWALPRVQRRKLLLDEPLNTKSDAESTPCSVASNVNSPPPIRTELAPQYVSMVVLELQIAYYNVYGFIAFHLTGQGQDLHVKNKLLHGLACMKSIETNHLVTVEAHSNPEAVETRSNLGVYAVEGPAISTPISPRSTEPIDIWLELLLCQWDVVGAVSDGVAVCCG
ncbi:Denticleless protein [Sesamum angolense]|uniref:Denticleless protein n=1 Tax=Sesamum angolense TaxID=2727404 RepID=A0AAE2BPG5_9LAMI|nr:Denticleless protein [Sesamum angolense]